MADHQQALALLVFVGGLSAATGMIIVETVALSTMVSNSLVLPALLRARSRLANRRDLSRLVLGVRRVTIVLVMLLGYGYFRLAGQGSALVSIGLVSFAAVAQFAPALLGGLFWKGGTRDGALVGLVAGFAVWVYCLLLPNFADAGWLPASFLHDGPFGLGFLRPEALFGLTGMDRTSHAMFWSMLVNVGGYVAVSLARRPNTAEQHQAVLFVDALAPPPRVRPAYGRASVGELRAVLERFLGYAGAQQAIAGYALEHGLDDSPGAQATAELIQHAETVLAGSVGTASARLVIAPAVAAALAGGEEQPQAAEMLEMIDKVSHAAALEERHRLARELHDSVCQALFSMTLHTRAVELAVQRQSADPDGSITRGLTELRSLTQSALADMRASIMQLRPDDLHEEGLAAALRRRATTIAAREGLEVRVHAPEDRLPLDDRAEEELFRVVQEAVHNSIKHAHAGRIDIRLAEHSDRDGSLVVEVADDGTGFDPHAVPAAGLGLGSMRERMERLGGRLVIDSRPTGSTTVRAVLPGTWRRRAPAHHQAAPPDGG
jgi:signal transduction histidine kinase